MRYFEHGSPKETAFPYPVISSQLSITEIFRLGLCAFNEQTKRVSRRKELRNCAPVPEVRRPICIFRNNTEFEGP